MLPFRLFVKNYKQTENPSVRNAYGKVAGFFGIATNAVLFLIKLILGLLSGSISIAADAVNNMTDAGSSLVTMLSFRLSDKPADEKHPFGHARMESISGLIVSCLVTAIGLELLKSSIERIISPEETTYSVVGICILALTMLLKLYQWLVYRTGGKKIGSTVLLASAADSINDVIATGVVVIGAIVGLATGWQIDAWLGCAVALYILVSGIKLVIETADPLLGTAPDPAFVKELSHKLLSYDGIMGIHDLAVHNYGYGRQFASVHAEVDAKADVMASHDLVDNIEYDVLREMGLHLTIHMDPIVTDDPELAKLKDTVIALAKTFHEEITVHDFRAVYGTTHTNLVFDVDLPFSFDTDDAAFAKLLSAKIKELDPKFNTVITVDRSYLNSRHEL